MEQFWTIDELRLQHLHQRVRTAMGVLLDGCLAGRDVDADEWAFATEICELRRLGITSNDLRWMVCRNFVEHAEEIATDGDERRFRKQHKLTISEASSFILTEAGREWIVDQLDAAPEQDGRYLTDEDYVAEDVQGLKPVWEEETRRLCLGTAVVKEFKTPAENQVRVIVAFQELSWPRRIDDPLLQIAEIDPKKRLHDTINSLNRNQRTPVMRFKGDGTGEGVLWEAADSFAPPRLIYG